MPQPDDKFAKWNALEKQMAAVRFREEAKSKLEDASSLNVLGASPETAFFTSLILKMERIEDDEVETAATDGEKLWYNPAYIAEQPLEKVLGLLCHEAMHKGLAHPARCGDREHDTWNKACDLTINPILRAAGINLPDGAIFPKLGEYRDIPEDEDTEQVYELLMMRKKKPGKQGDKGNGSAPQEEDEGDDPGPGSAPPRTEKGKDKKGQGEAPADHQDDQDDQGEGQGGGPGPVNDPGKCGAVTMPGDNSESAREASESQAKMDMIEASAVAKMMGDLPDGLARMIEQMLKKKVDWREVLRNFLTERAKNSVSWNRPNRRLLQYGVYLPGRDGRKIGRVAIAIDTSGSIGKEELDAFGSEVQGILQDFPGVKLSIIWHDSRVAGIQEWAPQDGELVLEPRGGGGTSHVPVFAWVDDQMAAGDDFACVVCFTDMCSVFPPAPDYPVLWLTLGSGKVTPPFGWHVSMEDD